MNKNREIGRVDYLICALMADIDNVVSGNPPKEWEWKRPIFGLDFELMESPQQIADYRRIFAYIKPVGWPPKATVSCRLDWTKDTGCWSLIEGFIDYPTLESFPFMITVGISRRYGYVNPHPFDGLIREYRETHPPSVMFP